MTLQIISPEGILLSAAVKSVTLPGSESSFTVLKNHAPILSTLTKGVIIYDGSPDGYAIDKGIVEVKNNLITIYV